MAMSSSTTVTVPAISVVGVPHLEAIQLISRLDRGETSSRLPPVVERSTAEDGDSQDCTESGGYWIRYNGGRHDGDDPDLPDVETMEHGATTQADVSAVAQTAPRLPMSGTARIGQAREPASRVGWTRRPTMPDERHVSVDLEAAIRGFAQRDTDVVVNPKVGMTFDSIAEAYEFYNLYSWELGFGIRYGRSRQNVSKTKCMQEIVCGCSVR